MPEPVEMKYHAQTLRLLGIDPKWSPRAVKSIERWEAKHRLRLPASIREWYTLETAGMRLWGGVNALVGLTPLLRRLAREVERIARLKSPPVNPFTGKTYTPVPTATILVMDGEGTDVVFDNPDDPIVNEDPRLADPFSEPKSFAEFVRDAAWAHWVRNGWIARVGAGGWFTFNAEASPPHLDYLWEQFEEFDRCRQPGFTDPMAGREVPETHIHRLFDRRGCVALSAAGDPTTGIHPASWVLTAADEPGLFALYERMWPCHGFPVQVYAPDTKANRGLRTRFRKRFPDAPRG